MNAAGNVVLVVEDEALVGWDLCDMLESDGYSTLGPAPSVTAAMEIIDSAAPCVALLDINLGNTTVWPVADRLTQLGVPIVFATADLGHPELHERFADVPRLGEPVMRRDLLQTIAKVRADAPTLN